MKQTYGGRTIGILASGLALITFARTFLENISNPDPGMFSNPQRVIYYFLFYCALYLSILVVVSFITKRDPRYFMYKILFGFLIILAAPLIDLIGTGGACMGYHPAIGIGLVRDFFLFFGKLPICGITLGIRIEIALVLVGMFFLSYRSGASWVRSLAVSLSTYVVIFIHVTLPGILATVFGYTPRGTKAFFKDIFQGASTSQNWTPISHILLDQETLLQQSFDLFMGRVFILTITVLSLVALLIWRKRDLVVFLRNCRPERVLYYILLAFLGSSIATALFATISFTLADGVALLVFLIALVSNFWFAVLVNDHADVISDTYSEPSRPLPSATLSNEMWYNWTYGVGTLALVSTLFSSYHVAIALIFFQVVHVLYSVWPFRLKRFLLGGIFSISAAGTSIVVAGYFLFSPYISFDQAPWILFLGMFALLAATVPAKDYKDLRGDRADAVETLPTLIGSRNTRRLLFTLHSVFWILVLIAYPKILLFIGGAIYFLLIFLVVKRRSLDGFIFFLPLYYIIIFLSLLPGIW